VARRTEVAVGTVPAVLNGRAVAAGATGPGYSRRPRRRWLLALELVGAPFYRRGMRRKDPRLALRTRTSLALGFGAAVFVCFLVPLGAGLVIPAAVAGATLLSRGVLGASLERRRA
jgi:hypothetical protein